MKVCQALPGTLCEHLKLDESEEIHFAPPNTANPYNPLFKTDYVLSLCHNDSHPDWQFTKGTAKTYVKGFLLGEHQPLANRLMLAAMNSLNMLRKRVDETRFQKRMWSAFDLLEKAARCYSSMVANDDLANILKSSCDKEEVSALDPEIKARGVQKKKHTITIIATLYIILRDADLGMELGRIVRRELKNNFLFRVADVLEHVRKNVIGTPLISNMRFIEWLQIYYRKKVTELDDLTSMPLVRNDAGNIVSMIEADGKFKRFVVRDFLLQIGVFQKNDCVQIQDYCQELHCWQQAGTPCGHLQLNRSEEMFSEEIHFVLPDLHSPYNRLFDPGYVAALAYDGNHPDYCSMEERTVIQPFLHSLLGDSFLPTFRQEDTTPIMRMMFAAMNSLEMLRRVDNWGRFKEQRKIAFRQLALAANSQYEPMHVFTSILINANPSGTLGLLVRRKLQQFREECVSPHLYTTATVIEHVRNNIFQNGESMLPIDDYRLTDWAEMCYRKIATELDENGTRTLMRDSDLSGRPLVIDDAGNVVSMIAGDGRVQPFLVRDFLLQIGILRNN